MIRIINDPEQVIDYHQEIVDRADRYRNKLGFIPHSAYENMIYQGKVFAAVEETATGKSCIGHLMFGGRFPNMRIFQVAIDEAHSQKGIGKKLVNTVIDYAKNKNYQSVKAHVGFKLDANGFWESMGFASFHTIKGKQTHPIINVRVYELIKTPLFLSMDTQISNMDIKSIVDDMQYGTSRCFLDVNIIIDMIKDRDNSEYAKYILDDMNKPYYEFFISPEVINELEHHSDGEDKALNIAKKIPRLLESENENLKKALLALVFPDQIKQNKITKNDLADAQHLATAISNNIDNFVTRDKGILRKRDKIFETYKLHVISSDELYMELKLQSPCYTDRLSNIGKSKITAKKNIKHDIIAPLISAGESIKWENNNSHHINNYAIYSQNNIIGFILLRKSKKGFIENIDVLITVCEKGHEGEYESDILHFFLEWVFNVTRQHRVADVQLTLQNSNKANEILLEHGYTPSNDGKYRKIFISKIITSDNWDEYHDTLKNVLNIDLPNMPPNFTASSQQIPIEHNTKVNLDKLESFISSIFLLPNREGVIVPIREEFAQKFFRHSKQMSLLSFGYDTPLSWKKSYFNSANTKKALTTGKLLLFYQSKKVGVIAIARIVGSYLIDDKKFKDVSHSQGVINNVQFDKISRGKTCLETVFDMPIIFPRPVSFEFLMSIGAGDKSNFITAREIKYAIIQKIIREGGVV